jgi:hypothetical protein
MIIESTRNILLLASFGVAPDIETVLTRPFFIFVPDKIVEFYLDQALKFRASEVMLACLIHESSCSQAHSFRDFLPQNIK